MTRYTLNTRDAPPTGEQVWALATIRSRHFEELALTGGMSEHMPMRIGEIIQHPAVFALGVGVANGVLAAVRDKPISPRAAAITAAVITAGETVLVLDEPPEQRPDLLQFAAWTVLGTYVGLYGFVSWKEGEKPIIQRTGEHIADWYYERQLEAGTAPTY